MVGRYEQVMADLKTPVGTQLALAALDPRNITLEPEYYGDCDQAKFQRVKPLLWLWYSFDRLPIGGQNVALGVKLRRALAPEGDSVIYQERAIHVASWAARFLFKGEQLNQPVERLSGGERARVLIAQLMLQPADVLLLDEPTNDLDIPTLEILEESLLEFRGSLVLVTHDRYMLDRVSTVVLGLDGNGTAEVFADYSQWESWQAERKADTNPPARPVSSGPASSPRKKLSYNEARQYASIEENIAVAERLVQSKRAVLENPSIASDGPKLLAAHSEMEQAQRNLDALYELWTELEEKVGNLPQSRMQ
jgi:ATP-binding cassette subfamily F protein uup